MLRGLASTLAEAQEPGMQQHDTFSICPAILVMTQSTHLCSVRGCLRSQYCRPWPLLAETQASQRSRMQFQMLLRCKAALDHNIPNSHGYLQVTIDLLCGTETGALP